MSCIVLAIANVVLLVSLSDGRSTLLTLLTFVERASFGVLNSRIILNLRDIALENRASDTRGTVTYQSMSVLVARTNWNIATTADLDPVSMSTIPEDKDSVV